MASTFVALDLPAGEAFLLQTEQDGRVWTILVDSGKKKPKQAHPLLDAIKTALPGLHRIDICICTHQDDDHANGFATFPDQWCTVHRTIGEFWLPGRWAAALPDALLDPKHLERAIAEGARQFVQEVGHVESRDFTDALRSFSARLRDEFAAAYNDRAQEETKVEAADTLGLPPARRPSHSVLAKHPFADAQMPSGMKKCITDAFKAAETVKQIAIAANKHSIPIRWFDFGPFEGGKPPSGGIKGLLEPMCAVEFRVPPKHITPLVLFVSLALSKENVESLVFVRPESDAEPGVLFLGDSRLAFGDKKPVKDFAMPNTVPKRRLAVTAPHHGSRNNDNAYAVLSGWLGNVDLEPIFIRNGGQSNQTLGAFKSRPMRDCAQCFMCHGRVWSKTVTLSTQSGNWSWPTVPPAHCP